MSNSHYINNKEFEKLVQGYLKEPEKYETELVETFDLLINNIIDAFKFKVDKDDAKQECFLLVFKILKNFDRESGSAFNYFTTVIMNNLRLLYTKKKKYAEKLNDLIEQKGGVIDPTLRK